MYYPEGREPMRLTGMKEYKIVREGIGRKFQVPSVFVNLTVLDNMILSLKGHKGIMDSIFGKPSEEELKSIDEVLEKVGLLDKKDVSCRKPCTRSEAVARNRNAARSEA